MEKTYCDNKSILGYENKEDFTEIYKQWFKEDPISGEVVEIGRKNSKGKWWIIGGDIYRRIIEKIYEKEIKRGSGRIDIDLLTEEQTREIVRPKGWELEMTSYGNLSFLKGRYKVDLNSLVNFHSIIARGLNPTIEHFLTGTPLDVQSIAYDYDNDAIIGKRGICAIRRKVVRINNLDEAKYESKKRGISIDDLVIQKAEELGFDYVLPKKTT